jgi:uncharacterized phage protein (TIGR02216 family)
MELGLGVLGLAPLAFWALTPRELQAALRGKFGVFAEAGTITRHDLNTLMQRFPDKGARNGNLL